MRSRAEWCSGGRLRRRALCVTGLAALVAVPAEGQEVPLGTLEVEVERLAAEWEIPGLGVAIVRGDSILLARGFGVRETGGEARVDRGTLFAIGSTTKAFTSAAVGMLVGEGVLDWDDPVVDHLPGFRLADPWVTREITLRDLLAHRSGLPMANLMWLPGHLDGDAMIRRLRHLEPTAGFRQELTYQNVLYLVVGRILAERSGSTWAAFLTDRILKPLAMRRTRPDLSGLEAAGNVATPHARIDGAVSPVPFRDITAVGPAGSMLSSAEDMARWLRLQLAGGVADGRRIIAEEALLETRRPQVILESEGPLSVFYPEARQLAYAMGWVVSDYRGLTMLDHGGGIDGMSALVALVPERDLGVAIMANRQLATPPYPILYPVLDRLLGMEPVDRTAAFRAVEDLAEEMAASQPERMDASPPSRALDAYAGRYESGPLGEAVVRAGEGGLVFELGRFTGALQPWHHDTFRVPWADRAWRAAAGPGWVTFRLDREGRVEALELSTVPGESWRFDRTTEEGRPRL